MLKKHFLLLSVLKTVVLLNIFEETEIFSGIFCNVINVFKKKRKEKKEIERYPIFFTLKILWWFDAEKRLVIKRCPLSKVSVDEKFSNSSVILSVHADELMWHLTDCQSLSKVLRNKLKKHKNNQHVVRIELLASELAPSFLCQKLIVSLCSFPNEILKWDVK